MDRSYCIAPMMGRTDSQFRHLIRLISKKTVLFTEMIHSNAILYGNKNKLEEYSNIENPIVLQIGGNDPKNLGKVSKLANKFNYDEINLNLGCPSPRVSSGGFGAALMNNPELVKDCLFSIKENFNKEVSVKIRLGTDDNDIDKTLDDFVDTIQSCNIKVFYVHARKAILKGLTPKQNLNIPKLNYGMVYEIKKSNPDLEIIINGGVTATEQIKKHLNFCDGVMIGRAIYQNPYFLKDIENDIFGNSNILSREDIVKKILEYLENEIKSGTKVNQVMRHTVGLYYGQPGSKGWKKYLSDNMMARDSDFQKAKHIMSIAQNNEKANQLTI